MYLTVLFSYFYMVDILEVFSVYSMGNKYVHFLWDTDLLLLVREFLGSFPGDSETGPPEGGGGETIIKDYLSRLLVADLELEDDQWIHNS